MQTLRKRSSPCKYKNEPSRFLGEGMTFKAKLIGILEVNEARGDKMCQDALNDLKTAIRAAGEHKQRITISIAIDGLRLRDEKSGDCLYHHPVHKISFIAQDMSDSRAFGYIFGSPDTGHRFFGIKTDKTASQVVISMRDLFQVVFELKKKEIEMAKHHIEQRQIKYGSTTTATTADSLHSLKDDYEADKGKGKYPQLIKIRCVTSKSADSGGASGKANTSEAIADLLDLQHELNSIQQGINQMDRITPSDPFGPLSKGDPFLDPFEDSFSSAPVENISEVKVPPPTISSKARSASQGCSVDSPTELDKQSGMFGASASAKSNFFSQFSPGPSTKAKPEETHWFDQETESLFNDRTNVSNTEPTSSPISFPTPSEKPDSEQVAEVKSPMKPDVFMELDPLGTGWVKPYVDKKDFFQDLKNPPKKVLKELLTENSTSDGGHHFLGQQDNSKSTQNTTPIKETISSGSRGSLTNASSSILPSFPSARYAKMDPFDDTDPFEKADPFSEKNFPNSMEIPSLFSDKSFDSVFSEVHTFEKVPKEEEIREEKNIFSSSSIRGPLRVSLPPEKADTNTPISLSSITSKFRSSPSPPEESRTLRRKNYQVLKQSAEDRGDDTPRSPVRDEFFCTSKSPKLASTYSPKLQTKTLKDKTSATKNKFWSDNFPEETPNPPPKPKSALFSIKPPPLPPKKQNQPTFKPPARPPSLEDSGSNYDYLKNQEASQQEPRSPKIEPQKAKSEGWKQTFPLLPPPPQRKEKPADSKPKETSGSILNITLNQLDNTGLENLAVTLGIPSDHIYNMTLQELTKRLSVKYLESSQTETFQADFESNFEKMETASSASTYDKYAVFKELIEKDNKEVNGEEKPSEEPKKEEEQEEEDRYAALRQLSLNPQKSENLSEDLEDEDGSMKADNLSDQVMAKTEDSFTPVNSVETPVIKSSNEWSPGEALVEKKEEEKREETVSNGVITKTESVEEVRKPEEEIPDPGKDNWATFDKVYEAPEEAKADDVFNDNDNSPFSSDGKDDSFDWRKKKGRGRNEVPWRDEDESWDDYSPKESYWSDESSHDDRSPEKKRDGRYQRRTWSKQIRKSKGDHGFRRSKWNEDTEDEYEEWKNRRCRMGSCDADRKVEVCPLNNYEWCNSRSEPCEEGERYRCYRKKSESDDEYRRRCDSDTSDREYVWTFKRGYQEGYSRNEKQKQYHMLPYTSRDYPERCHEPRSKHRKSESHKRPSSASEGKRNYEKMYSTGEFMSKGKRGSEDDHSSYHKDFRYCCGPESVYYYDRRFPAKKTNRSRRGDSADSYTIESKDKKESFDYYKSTWHKSSEKSRQTRHHQFEDDFAPVTPEKPSPKREPSRSPRRKPEYTGGDAFESPEAVKEPAKQTQPQQHQQQQQQVLNKNHFAVLTRQESSASLRKSESINIFSRENDPFEGDDFFTNTPSASHKLNRFTSEKSKSNSNVSDAFVWKEVFGESSFRE